MSREEITSAAETSIGFDYQFYYFFYLLLDLRLGEKIGIEVKDDVHVELANRDIIYVQLKHTLQKSKSGDAINLSERDKDLWKTLANWTKLILEKEDKINFIEKSKFQLISNKSLYRNPFVIQLEKLREKEIKVSEFKAYLRALHDKTKDIDICNYINELKSLKSEYLQSFVKRIDFNLNQDNLIIKIKERILEKILRPERVEDVYNSLHSELRDNNYLTIKSGSKTELSFDEFMLKFKNCFRVGLTSKLPVREFDFVMPDNPESQKFIKQLIDINDISLHNKDLIVEFTTQMLQLYNNLKTWEDSGDLLPSERKKFNKETIAIWKTSFRSKFRDIVSKIEDGNSINDIDPEIKRKAVEFLDEMRKQILNIDETQLTIELSNGQFYLLTEENTIGWHYDWENKYKK